MVYKEDTRMRQSQRETGFTLLELMVALVIVGVLAAIAIPSWSGYMKKSRRADAMTTLLNLQLQEEKWRANDTDYATLAELGFTTGSGNSVDGYYTMAVVAASVSGYTITATPYDNQAGDSCGTYAINQDGPIYSGYANADCWGH